MNTAATLSNADSRPVRQAWLIVAAAFLLTAFTVLVLPLTELLAKPSAEKDIIVRSVNTVTYQPLPPPVVPPQAAHPKPERQVQPAITPTPLPSRPALDIALPLDLELAAPRLMPHAALTFEVAATPTTLPEPGRAAPFTLAEVDSPPRVLTQVEPIYPFAARARNIEGYAEVQFVVTREGEVSAVEVLESVPPGVFDRAAAAAVRQWRFTPAQRANQAVAATMQIRIRFELD
jgi:protein TonB